MNTTEFVQQLDNRIPQMTCIPKLLTERWTRLKTPPASVARAGRDDARPIAM